MKKLIFLSILAVFISSVSFGQSDASFNKVQVKDKIVFKPKGKTEKEITYNKVISIDNVLAGTTYTAYSAGTVYNLTATPALLDFSTTDPSITIAIPGTYVIMAGANYGLAGVTYADSSRTAFCKLYRTNNTAAYLTDGYDLITIGICTTSTTHAGTARIPAIIYTTTNANDVITLRGWLSTTPSAGNVVCRRAFITAYRIK